MQRLAAGLFVVSALTSATAQTPLMNSIDFLVDYKTLIGREVNVGPCKISQADMTSVYCKVQNPSGREVGTIKLRPESMSGKLAAGTG